ncbi:hypothetical protein CMV_012118 [Castanea mollissima]|uniref:Uncharacterized protein n=1 Tax=Castanea mollissima TaxID=60419 RepID=A0A8J4RA24_9ROSI|nr:hypothetical protein CMV_012118 [Castanea mollissima]
MQLSDLKPHKRREHNQITRIPSQNRVIPDHFNHEFNKYPNHYSKSQIPEIGGKPKQWAEEGSGGGGFGRDELGFEVDESGRRWCVSFGGGGEEVDESVRVCG